MLKKALKKSNHPPPIRPQYSPHRLNRPVYGIKTQMPTQEPKTTLLDKDGKTRIQSIVNTFKQSTMLLDYLAMYPNPKLRFYVGNMQLHIESDAAYLVLPGAKSRVAGYFYLHSEPNANKCYRKGYNAPIHVECATLKMLSPQQLKQNVGEFFKIV